MSGPRVFRPVVTAAVAVIVAPFLAAVIIATRHGSLDDSGGSLGDLDGSLDDSFGGSLVAYGPKSGDEEIRCLV